jgi:5'-phosphate synthase pdxT subunit
MTTCLACAALACLRTLQVVGPRDVRRPRGRAREGSMATTMTVPREDVCPFYRHDVAHGATTAATYWSTKFLPKIPLHTFPTPTLLLPTAITMSLHVGVLAMQGGYKEVFAALQRQPGVVAHEVRTAGELAAVQALVLPGGESTCIGRLLELSELLPAVQDFVLKQRKPVMGICAGLILLADDLAGDLPKQPLIGGLNVKASRNHFGRQASSRFRQLELTEAGRRHGLHDASHFIRAPALVQTGEGVEVLAKVDGLAVAVREGNLLGIAFHPEAHHDDSYFRFFLKEVCGFQADGSSSTGQAGHRASVAPPMVSVGEPALKGAAAVLAPSVKRAFPIFQQGGVIMDVVNAEQVRVDAGARLAGDCCCCCCCCCCCFCCCCCCCSCYCRRCCCCEATQGAGAAKRRKERVVCTSSRLAWTREEALGLFNC